MATLKQHIRHLWGAACAVPATLREYVRFRREWKKLKDKLPQGDGHPVLVLPGMLTGDFFYKNFRRHIAEKNYQVQGWDNGINLGFNAKTIQALRARLEDVYEQSGQKKVTIIGHSLGGIYARELAREFPDMVRDVITMGSPFGGLSGGDAIPHMLRKIFERFSGTAGWRDIPDLDARGLTPPPVPVTSIYSKDDPIIKWQSCLNPAGQLTENVEISANTHMGLTFAKPSLVAIFDRLAQKEGAWQPFDAAAYKELTTYRPAPGADDLPKNPGWVMEAGKAKGLFGGN